MVRVAGIEPARLAARDFKSLVSTYFTTLALIFKEQVCIIHELASLSTSCCIKTTFSIRE